MEMNEVERESDMPEPKKGKPKKGKPKKGKPKKSQGTLALELVKEKGAETWMDEAGTPHITVEAIGPNQKHPHHAHLGLQDVIELLWGRA